MKSLALSLLLLSLGLFCLGCQRDFPKERASKTTPATGAPGENTGEIPAAVPKTEEKKADEKPTDGIVRPGILGEGWIMLLPTDFKKTVARGNKKIPKLSSSQMENWVANLRTATANECSTDECVAFLVGFLPQSDIFWQDDRFQVPVLDQAITRLGKLPVEQVETWRRELNKVTFPAGGGAMDVETVGYLLQMARLFRGNDFLEQESTSLLARVRSVPKDAVDTQKELAECTRHQAVIMLIQDDRLFRENLFQQKAFKGRHRQN